MAPRDLGDPDSILALLSGEIQAIHDALDHGASEADGFFLSRGEPLDDPQLWSYLVRRAACQRLDQVEEHEWERLPLRLAGIHIVRDGIHVRVLKSRDGSVPPPGSNSSQQYYSQLSLLPEDVTNLIFDWQMDAQRQATCHLSQPMGSLRLSRAPVLVWRRRLELLEHGITPRFAAAADEADSVGLIIDSSELGEANGL